MPIERREIILTGNEPLRAVAAMARGGAAFLPGRNVSAVTVQDAP